MPRDAQNRFHINSQRAHASDRASEEAGKKESKPTEPSKASKPDAKQESMSGGGGHTIHDHGDGTFHSEGPAGHMEHPSLGHAITHAAHSMAGGGKHMHHHSDGMSVKSHGMTEEGEHTENEHGSGDEAAQDTAAFMGEGGGMGEPGMEEQGMGQEMHQGGGLAGY